MKKIMILIGALTLSSGAFAQDDNMGKMNSKMENKNSNMNQTDHDKDHLKMKDGKMVMVKNGKTMNMDKAMTLSNGTIVMMDGKMKTKDGKSMMMKEGDMIYMDGKMGKMEMDKPMNGM